MSRTLTIPDELYEQLEKSAEESGVAVESLVEELLEGTLAQSETGLRGRKEVIDHIFAFHEYMKEKYGIMSDSVELIREDREQLLP